MKNSPEVTNAISNRDNDSSRARTRANISGGESSRPRGFAAAISANDVAILASLHCDCSFHSHRAREENVVFEMYVEVQILFKFL